MNKIVDRSISQNPAKISVDMIWTLASFCVMGGCGIIFNVLIARNYSAEVLGIFNQVYAFYVFLSQLATGGIQLSVLKYTAENWQQKFVCDTIITSALVLAFVLSGIVACAAYLLHGIFGWIVDSPAVGLGVVYTIPGLFFFSVNKVLLYFHNGLRRMKFFSLCQSLRYLLLIIFLILFIGADSKGAHLAAIFSFTEGLLFLILFTSSMGVMSIRFSKQTPAWIRRHLPFGAKGLVGNIFAGANTRVDVLILGYFLSDRLVGIYSFTAILAEGFYQLITVVQINMNPLLTQLRYKKSETSLISFILRWKRITYMIFIPLGGLSILIYPLAVDLLVNGGGDYTDSWEIFTVLITGMVISSGFLPFRMIFNQSGFPGTQSLFLILVFCTNVVFNLIMIPPMGILGAAFATAAAFVSQIFLLKYLSGKRLGVNF